MVRKGGGILETEFVRDPADACVWVVTSDDERLSTGRLVTCQREKRNDEIVSPKGLLYHGTPDVWFGGSRQEPAVRFVEVVPDAE